MVSNWNAVAARIVDIALMSIDSIKLLFALVKKLSDKDQHYLMELLSYQVPKDNLLRDLIRINYLFMQKYTQFTSNYENYI